MSDQIPSHEPPASEPPRTEEAHAERAGPGWLPGAILIVVGLIFLARNFAGFTLHNWWALFILIPAIGSLASAWRLYQTAGRRMTAAVRGPLIGGLILLLVTAIFLFNLDWGKVWPAFIIVVGIGVLLSAL